MFNRFWTVGLRVYKRIREEIGLVHLDIYYFQPNQSTNSKNAFVFTLEAMKVQAQLMTYFFVVAIRMIWHIRSTSYTKRLNN